MSRFVITITPDNGDNAGTPGAQTTVRVDTSSGHTRITELTVRAAGGGGLAPTDLPAVDLDLLVRALAAPAVARALPPETEAEVMPLPAPSGTVEPAEVAAEPSIAAPGRQSGEEAATTASGRRGAAKAGGRRGAAKAGGRGPRGRPPGAPRRRRPAVAGPRRKPPGAPRRAPARARATAARPPR